MSLRRTSILAAAAAATALVLAACGGGDEDDATDDGGDDATGGGESSELTPVSLGGLPIFPTAALQLGIDEGFFEEEGLDATLELSQGGAAVIPAVVSGDLTAGTSNVISLFQAREQGIDVRIIAHWSSGATEEPDVAAILTLPDSGIATAADLEGRTIAVNTLNNIGEMAVRAAIREDGGDDELVEFVEMGFPDMPAALDAGNIDAAYTPEPFMTLIQDNGGTVVTYPHLAVTAGMPTQMFFTTGELIDSDPELVERLTAAVNATLEYAEANPDAVREAAVEMLDMDPALAARVEVERFGSDLRRSQIQDIADLILDMGMISETADMDGLMPAE